VAAPGDTLRHFDFAAVGASVRPVEIGASLHPVRDLGAAGALRRGLRAPQARGAIVHAHGVRAGVVAALAVRSLPRRPPLVLTVHNAVLGDTARARFGRAVQDAACRAADGVLAVSGDLVARARAAGARHVHRALVPAPERPIGDGARVRAEFGAGSIVLVVARLAPQKGLDVLLDAVARLRTPTRVLIAGDGPLRAALQCRIDTEGLPVRLLGARTDVADLLALADVVVSSSVWEGQPVFLQEALRAGTPIVATDAGGTVEVTGAGAELVPVGDAPALAAAVDSLLGDPERWMAAGRAALARSGELPTAEQALAQVVAEHAAARARLHPGASAVG
ncbi:MAG: glycosyltransferase, partial [Janthinobacterium lividum]